MIAAAHRVPTLHVARNTAHLSRSAVLRGSTAAVILSRGHRVMAAAKEPVYEAWVKGFKDPSKKDLILGDCPFSHRALLTLEEKHIPYVQKYVDLKDKPDWLLKLNEKGSVPVLKDLKTGKWLTSSDEIVDALEEQIPEPALGKSDSLPEAGSKVFPAFVQFLKADDAAKDEKKAALEAELAALDSHLSQNGPFLKGENISAGDLALAPKLYHLQTALRELKGWDKLGEYKQVHAYLSTIEGRDSWKKTYYAPDIVIAGWKAH